MRQKFEKLIKAKRKRKAKQTGLGIKYSSLNDIESKEIETNKTKLKRLKSPTKMKPKKQKHGDSICLVNNTAISPTDQMKNLDLRPLVIEIFD